MARTRLACHGMARLSVAVFVNGYSGVNVGVYVCACHCLADNIYVYIYTQPNTSIYLYVCIFTCDLCMCSEPSNLVGCAGQLVLPHEVALKS